MEKNIESTNKLPTEWLNIYIARKFFFLILSDKLTQSYDAELIKLTTVHKHNHTSI